MPDVVADIVTAPSVPKPRDDEIDVFGLTHTGKVRKANQDHFLLASLHKRIAVHGTSLPAGEDLPTGEERLAFVAVVADGVGGGERGEEASRVAVQQAMQYVTTSMNACYAHGREEAFTEALQEAAMQAHEQVQRRGAALPDFKGMATTLTLWLGVWPWIYVLQVGDSRYYVFRDDKLTQVSRDQTIAQDLLDQGIFTRTDAFRSKWAHVLSSAIGGSAAAPVVTRLPADWRNIHLMCSDGLTKHVGDEKIAERLRTMTSAKQVCEQLLQDALEDGGSDNITIVVGRAVPGGTA